MMISAINSTQRQRQNFGAVTPLEKVIVNGVKIDDPKQAKPFVDLFLRILMKADKNEPNDPHLIEINNSIRTFFNAAVHDYKIPPNYKKFVREVYIDYRVKKINDYRKKIFCLITGESLIKALDVGNVVKDARSFNSGDKGALKSAYQSYGLVINNILGIPRLPAITIIGEKYAGKDRPVGVEFATKITEREPALFYDF